MSFEELEELTSKIDVEKITQELDSAFESNPDDMLLELLNDKNASFSLLCDTFNKKYKSIRESGKTDFSLGNYYLSANKKFVVKYEDSNIVCIVDSTYGTHYEHHLSNEEKNFVIVLDKLENKRLGSELIITKAIYDIIPKIYYKKEVTLVDNVANEDITISLSDEASQYGIDKVLKGDYECEEKDESVAYYHIEKNVGSAITHPSDILKTESLNEFYPIVCESAFSSKLPEDKVSVTMNKVYDKKKDYYDFSEINEIVTKTQKLYSTLVRFFDK